MGRRQEGLGFGDGSSDVEGRGSGEPADMGHMTEGTELGGRTDEKTHFQSFLMKGACMNGKQNTLALGNVYLPRGELEAAPRTKLELRREQNTFLFIMTDNVP